MGREILFRGKGKETGEWYYGSYLRMDKTTYCFAEDYASNPDNTEHFIVFTEMTDWGLPNRRIMIEVDPKTVGQFIETTDKNRARIFEGDIVKGKVHTRTGYRVRTGVIEYYIDAFKMKVGNEYKEIPSPREIVGNAYDNPELLEEHK